MHKTKKQLIITVLILFLTLLATTITIFARPSASKLFATAPDLGAADSFAVLGSTTVTNTGDSIVNGDLGLSPGTSVTGFPPGVVNGTIHIADTAAQNAQNDAALAYNNLTGQACDENLTGQDLGGKTLTPGVYCFDSTAQLTGTLTLDAQGDEFSVFIFQIGSTLTTATSSLVNVINGENLCNVFWQVGSSATLGASTAFKGNILALTSITVNTSATIDGRAFAQNGAVSLDTNIITIPICALQTTPTSTSTSTSTATSTLTSTATQTVTPTLPEATQTAIANTQTAIATLPAATQTAIANTQTAIATLPAATQTAIATQTLQAATQAAIQTATENVLKLTGTSESETYPDTNAGGELAGPGPQILFIGLGALGLILTLIWFILSRRSRKAEK